MKISNCSSIPITIDEAKIIYKNKELIYLNSEKSINNKHKTDENSSIIMNLYKQPQLPLRIDCYDSVFLSFIFPFIDEILQNEFEFILITPRKNYKKKYHFKDFNDLFND